MRAIHVDRDRSVPGPRVRRAVRPAEAAVVLAIVMAPAGCAGSEPDSAWPTTARTGRPVAGAPATTEPATSSSTATGTSKPTTPAGSATATTSPEDAAQAIAAVQHFYDVFNRAGFTHSSTELRALFLPECEPCFETAHQIDQLAANHLVLTGGHISISALKALVGDKSGLGVTGTVHFTKATLTDPTGKVVDTFDPGEQEGEIWILKYDHGRWKIYGFGPN